MNATQDGTLDSLEGCYHALSSSGDARARAEELLGRRHWIHEAGEHDQRTGEMLPESLGRACARLRSPSAGAASIGTRDRLYRILQHVHGPLEEILRRLHEGLVREHASLPLRAVRELDTSSFFALSRRSGRTVREKLADRPYLWAVERRWTVDTAENRLVKAFCARIADLLRARGVALQESDESWVEDLGATVEAWLLGTAAKDIGRWENLPPNNLLLEHRDYRRIWNAWSWTQTLDEDVRRDRDCRVAQWATMLFWSIVAHIEGSPRARVVEQAAYLDYEEFSIVPGRTRGPALARVDGLLIDDRRSERPFCVELHAAGGGGSRILLRPSGQSSVEIACEAAGDRVSVRVGSRTSTCDASPAAAVKLADTAAAMTFGILGSTAASAPARPAIATTATCAVDLCTLRPRFARDGEKGVLPFRLLWQYWHQPDREAVPIDLGTARAVALGDEGVDTVSILDLLAAESAHSPATLVRAARSFAAAIHAALPSESLTYILPDGTDEFALGPLRRSINAVFPVAEPLPRSVAVAFEWQSSPRFANARVRDGDCLLVLDTVGEILCATPLIASRSHQLAKRLPESGGIFWERCPSIQAGPESTSVTIAGAFLKEMACPFPGEVARLCGFQGLLDEGSGLSWQNLDGDWFSVPPGRAQVLGRAIQGLGSPWAPLARGLDQEIKRLTHGARVFVTIVGDAFRRDPERFPLKVRGSHEVVPLGAAGEPHAGALALRRWQARAGELPLWCDRLPELSMRIVKDGRHARFDLVRKITVEPRRGQAVRIPIHDAFILNAQQPHYQFPLLQGAGGSELRYEAFLASPSFPLGESLPVELELSYSYGSDMPYELVFTNRERRLRVRAEWRPRDDTALPSHYPTPPPPDPWSRFAQYPKLDSEETTSLFDWIRENVERVRRQLEVLPVRRQSATVSSSWRCDRNDRRFTFANSDVGRVFVHEGDFVVPQEVEGVEPGTTLQMEIERTDKGLNGRWITVASDEDAEVDERILCQKLNRLVEAMRKGLRFPFLTIWADGHSLSEPDAPEAFRQVMRCATEILVRFLLERSSEEASADRARQLRRMSDEALFLLCCMHRDAPAEVAAALKEAIDAGDPEIFKPWRLGRHVALALGDGDREWQRGLLGEILAVLRRKQVPIDLSGACLQVLGMALWQCPALLARLSESDLRPIIRQAAFVLDHDLARLVTGNEGGIDPRQLKDHLELVLALLRTRASDDAITRGVLAPGKPAAKALASTVERIIDVVSERDIPIKSRVMLAVEKPPTLHNTPDLLYALQLYLTGNDGARAIQVVAVRKDEQPGDAGQG